MAISLPVVSFHYYLQRRIIIGSSCRQTQTVIAVVVAAKTKNKYNPIRGLYQTGRKSTEKQYLLSKRVMAVVNMNSVGRFALASLVYFAAATTTTTNTVAAKQQQASSSSSSSSSATADRDDPSSWSAGKLRSRGDEAMSLRKFDEALDMYTKATEKDPENGSNYHRLFKVHNRMKQWAKALSDIEHALELEADNVDWRIQKAKLLKSLGQCDRAVAELAQVQVDNGGDASSAAPNTKEDLPALLQEASECDQTIAFAQKALLEEDYPTAAHYFQVAMRFVEQASDLLLQKASALLQTGDYYGVISDTGKILKQFPQHLEAYRLRGMAYFWLGDHDVAIQHFREALKSDPEHKGCKDGHKLVKKIEKKKKKADEAFAAGKYEDAIKLYAEAMAIEPEHVNFSRPTRLLIIQSYSKLNQHDRAIQEAQTLLEEIETLEAHWALGDALTAAEKFEEAVRAFQAGVESLPEGETEQKKEAQRKVQAAQVALKQSKEKNYYKILGVSRTASAKEIKSAYRKLALQVCFRRTLKICRFCVFDAKQNSPLPSLHDNLCFSTTLTKSRMKTRKRRKRSFMTLARRTRFFPTLSSRASMTEESKSLTIKAVEANKAADSISTHTNSSTKTLTVAAEVDKGFTSKCNRTLTLQPHLLLFLYSNVDRVSTLQGSCRDI